MSLHRLFLAPLLASFFASFGPAGFARAQSPLVTTYASNGSGSAGGQVLFDLSIRSTVTITRLDVNTGAPLGTPGTIEVWLAPTTWIGNENTPAAWTLAGSGRAIARGADVPTPVCLPNGIVLPAGTVGIAVRHVGIDFRRTNGNGTNQVWSTAELTLTAGAAQNVPFGATFTPRVFNGALHYRIGAVAGPFVCAASTAYGAGCHGLGLTAPTEARLGSTALLRTAVLPSSTVLCASLLGLRPFAPGLSLDPIGAPGCRLLVAIADVVAAPAGGATFDRSLAVPPDPVLLGVVVFAQTVAFAPGVNALGIATSDALRLSIGNA